MTDDSLPPYIFAGNVFEQQQSDYPKPCSDCNELHKYGDHIVWQGSDGHIAWQGCLDCYIKRTNPIKNKEIKDETS